MPEFKIGYKSDGKTHAGISRDDVRLNQAVLLESCHQVVVQYFRMALDELERTKIESDPKAKRDSSLKAFLFSFLGIEAFSNTFFLLNCPSQIMNDVTGVIEAKNGTTLERLKKLLKLRFNEKIGHHDRIFDELKKIQNVRDSIAHPKWVESSIESLSWKIDGLVENPFVIFDNSDFSEKCVQWCVLFISEVALLAKTPSIESFVWIWTGIRGVELADLTKALKLKKAR